MKTFESFEIEFPIPRTHCGIYMGNGNLGAMIWGNKNLKVTVNRADFWDHRGGETLIEGTTYKKILEAAKEGQEALQAAFIKKEWPDDVFKSQRIPVGRFEFKIKDGFELNMASLDYAAGEVTATTKSGEKILINLGAYKNVITLEDKDSIIAEILTVPSWEFEQSREWLEKYAFEKPQSLETENGKGWAQPCPDDPSLASVCEKINGDYIISLELGKTNEEALENAIQAIRKSGSPGEIKNSNAKWWGNYWKDVPELNTPEEFFNEFYKYALYKFACATSPESPIPSGLQGPWIEEYQRAQWSGDYHFNVNIQQIYTLAFSTGKLDHLLPLFDMLESETFWANMRHNAKVFLGIDDGLLLTHAVDDRGFQCGWISAGSSLDQACGAWTAQLYWLYYKYSLDKEFLKNRAHPFMSGVMRVYEEILEERNGKLSIPLAISAEYGCRNPNGLSAGRDPSYQLACIHMLLDALFETCETLQIAPQPIWSEMKEKVPYFTTAEGLDPYKQAEKRIAVWEGQDLEVCHRHHSHLGSIYPFDSLPEEQSEEMRKIVDDSLDHWILMGMGQWSEWCIPWAAIIQARMGFNNAPMALLNMWKEIFVNEGMNTVYLPRFRGIIAHRRHDMNKPKESNEVIQIDGTMGCATALLENMAHTHSGVTKIFAGVPDKWKNVSFKNIRLPGPFTASASKENGKFKEARIRSLGGEKIKLNILGVQSAVLRRNGKTEQIQLPCSLDLKRDEEIILTAI